MFFYLPHVSFVALYGLDPAWVREGDTVGITAGTSTPDSVIDGVEAALRALSCRSPSEARSQPPSETRAKAA